MMIGQGRPSTSGGRRRCVRRAVPCTVGLLAAIVLGLRAYPGVASEETLRIRIEWGGGAPTLWHGTVAVSGGTLSEPHSLGMEADEPGSMWLERGPALPIPPDMPSAAPRAGLETDRLMIRQRSPRTYDGLDLLVSAPLEANLLIAMSPSDSQKQTSWITVPLAELVHGFYTTELDDRGNRLLVHRAPGDTLRVTLAGRSLVFAPGETLRLRLRPHLLPVDPETRVKVRVEIAQGRDSHGSLIGEYDVAWEEEIPIEQPLPDEEGVYDVLVTASTQASLGRLPSPVRVRHTLAVRRIQLLVLRPDPPEVPVGDGSSWSQVVEIDPANPKWYEQLWERLSKLPQPSTLSRLYRGPLGSGDSQVWRHSSGSMVQLRPSRGAADVSWEAYTLPIDRPSRPHVLELEYPSDLPQTLGISIIEPNVSGAVVPIGLDSGVELADEVASHPPHDRATHRLIFWPKTKSPMVLLTNRRRQSPAAYGKIRVLAGGDHLPRAFPRDSAEGERLLAAYLDRPLLPESFSADLAAVSSTDRGADDWLTFYQAGTRLVEYLHHVGLGGLMISVLADGSTIYPSQILEPTPRYDTGVFLENGQDPVRKDVLEMLFRLFDREGLKLIPAMEFAAPLPELEAELRHGSQEAAGIRWIGKDGITWQQTYGAVRAMAPYYNVLHPRVQEAILAAVREVAGRYGHHRSFAGLAIQLSAYGYAQLPGPSWGMDDLTIARFEQDTGVRVPGAGRERFAERARFLAPPSLEQTASSERWLGWRAGQLHKFYQQVRSELVTARPEARLYLAGANMLAGAESEHQLRPALPRRMTITQAMLAVGIDARHYAQDDGIVLLRPGRIVPRGSLARQALRLEIEQMPDVDRVFEGLPVSGSLFFHPPQELRLESFDQKSPFKPSYTWLITEPVPSGWQNRRRFVHSLATLDSQVMFDGGWQLPMGQEASIRDLVAAYRRLPAVRFKRLTDASGSDPAQPVAIRYATSGDATYVYLVNDAPFATAARIELGVRSDCRLEELSGLRAVAALQPSGEDACSWTVSLKPYDLVAVRFSAPGVTLSGAQAFWPDEVQAELEAQIDDLYYRAAALKQPPVLDVLENSHFERPSAEDGRIPGWEAWSRPGASVRVGTSVAWSGNQAVHFASPGRGLGASLISRPFDPPSTGRLTMAVRVRAAPSAGQPYLRYILQGKLRGEPFFRWQDREVRGDWESFIVPFSDLPLEGLSQLRVRFDLYGPGEVWIDEVQLCSLDFSNLERIALYKLISPTDPMLEHGQIRDCIHLLEGYWPQFLAANVPLPQLPTARRPKPPEPSQNEPDRSPGFFERMKALVPRSLRLF